ncbi:MAG: efflux transporter outer membrane subunit [Desulfovibrio sp.]|jgi:Cu(I)/Ag(I) efflux system outer membrane protein|nr:efflux transporter outer membrane subunit [Desulfovibrio sp.]
MITHIHRQAKILCLLAVLLTASACSLAPDYIRPAAPIPLSITASPAGPRPAAGAVTLGTRDFFRDPRLQELIAAALRQNRDLRLALLAVREAGAQYRVQRADRLPQLDGEASDTYGGDLKGKESNLYMVSSAAVLDPDLFGRLKSLSEAALQRYQASEEAAKAARILLVAQTAQSYLNERLAAELLRLAERTLQSRQSSLAFIERRVQSGQSSLLDLEQARGMTESAKAEAAAQKNELTRAENALKLLLGSFEPQPLPPPTALTDMRFAALPQGLPSSILLERPDIMEAEHELQATNADIGAARAAFFPSISLTGSLGVVSNDLNLLFSGATSAWTFLPKIGLPVFSGGRDLAGLDLAEVRKESAVVRYEQRIQTAFREVADALLTRSALADRLAAQKRYLQSQQLVLRLATTNYVNGAVSYLTVLDAQRSVFDAERTLLAILRDQLVNDVELYAALGGGRDAGGDTGGASPRTPPGLRPGPAGGNDFPRTPSSPSPINQ